MGKGLVIAIGGLSGTGKSTLSRHVGRLFSESPVVSVASDVVRKTLWGVDSLSPLPVEAYSSASSAQTYAALYDKVEAALASGSIAVADATFSDETSRFLIEEVARDNGAAFIGIWLEAADETMKARVDARKGDPSDATSEIVDLQLKKDIGSVSWPKVEAGGSVSHTLTQVREILQKAGWQFKNKSPSLSGPGF